MDQDLEIINAVDGLQHAIATRQNSQEMIYMKKLRLRHPMFFKVNFNAFKYVIDCSYLIKPIKRESLATSGLHRSERVPRLGRLRNLQELPSWV
jgi:hypothetical protein